MTTIFKMLDVSSSHLSHKTATFLSNGFFPNNDDLIVHNWFDSGWITRVPSSSDDTTCATLALTDHRSLAAVLLHAQKLGCDYVKLDQDGEVIDGLETYNW